MNEHDDDLESKVHDGADKEIESFPDTGDELDEPAEPDDLPELDDDPAEL